MKKYIPILVFVLVVGAGLFLLVQYLVSSSKNKVADNQISFSTTPLEQLPEASKQQTVELKNGDIFDLKAEIVRKKIGNLEVKMLGYNGSVPGPLIKVVKGSEVTINFTNNTDVPTTIHSHGVRVDNAFDGVPDVTQKEVKVGESFVYKIKFPDEGMYWYHPHIREDYAQELGLYGNYLVTPNDPNYWSPVNQEQALFLDDVLFDDNGIAAFDSKTADHTLMGRFGGVMLVNGKSNYKLTAKAGEVVRFYLTNAANTRTFKVRLVDAKMKLVGGDSGKYEQEQFVEEIVIGPSERAIVEVLFDRAGSFTLEHKTPDRTYPLASIAVSADSATPSFVKEFNQLRENKDIKTSIDPFRSDFVRPADKQLKLSLDMMGNMMNSPNMGGHMMMDGTQMSDSMMAGNASEDGIEWEDTNNTMNEMSTAENVKWKLIDLSSGQQNMDIDWKFKKGDNVKISIFNDPKSAHPMQHPIHFHGQRFLVLSTNGVKNDNLVWKDTVMVPTGDTVEILVDMSNPGEWMAHCHIAEHLEAGMMLKYSVE